MSRGGYRAAAAAIVLLAAVLRFWALDLGLPHLMARPDDEAILLQTEKPARGHADLAWAVYPSAYIYLCFAWGAALLPVAHALGAAPAASYLAALTSAPARVLLVLRSLSATLGTVTVALLIATARPALGRRAALAAGALLATNFLHARDCHSVKPEAALALGVVLTLRACLPLARRATLARGAMAGVAVGFATAMKYPGLLLLAPVYLAAILGDARRGLRRLLPASAIVAGACAFGVFAATSPYLFLNATTREAMLWIVRVVFPQLTTMPAIARPSHAVTSFGYHALFSLPYGAGYLEALLAPAGVAWAMLDRRPLPLLAATFALVYYLVVGASPVPLARYMTPLMPVLALLVAGLLDAAAARLAPRRATACLALATAVVVMQPLAATIAHDRLAARTDTRVLATRWMATHLSPGARVDIVGTHLWTWGVPQLPPGVIGLTVEPTLEALRAAHAGYVLTHDHVLFSSRVDWGAIRALDGHLRLLADFDPFAPGRTDAVFEAADAYYIPIAHFGAVVRPGPHVRIYAFEAEP